MQFRLADLDPTVVRRLLASERAVRIIAPPPPTQVVRPPAPGEGPDGRPRVTPVRIGLAVLMVPLMWVLSLFLAVAGQAMTGSESVSMAIFFLLAAAAPPLAINWLLNGWRLPRRGVSAGAAAQSATTDAASEARVLNAPLSLPILESVFESVIPVGPQAGYARSVLTLLELVEKKHMDEQQARDVLSQLNALMASDADLGGQAEEIEAAADRAGPDRLKAEMAEIEARLAIARDPVARQALERSRELLEARLANADSLALIRERVDAQREAIEQTLGSLEAALVRLHFSGDQAATDALNITRLQETVAAFDRESRAVEQAIQEVARL